MKNLIFDDRALSYRADIDGLRALAVLAVIGFHAFGMKSGFVGVDIFFVISGYLITSILFREIKNDNYSILNFYSRRIRRIFPGVILVLFFTLIVGWFILFPNEYQSLGRHAWGGAGFVSNFISLQESGYFKVEAEQRPLLHLWSLGVEEQFYFIWPILLWIIWRLKISFMALAICLFLISFYFNLSGLAQSEQVSFFSPQSRFWELTLGAVVAYLHSSSGGNLFGNKLATLNYLSWFGFSLVAIGFLFINKNVVFPGYWALLPTLGAALIIFSGQEAGFNKLFLSNKWLVRIGLISFPLYLWHWPLLVYPKILQIDINSSWKLILMALTFLLSWWTYFFIEKPIRHSKNILSVSIGLTGIMGAIFTVGVLIQSNIIQPKTTDFEIDKASLAINDWEYPSGLDSIEIFDYTFNLYKGGADVTVMMGDSNVEHYSPRVISLHQSAVTNTVYWGARGGCLPIPHVFQDADQICPEVRSATLKLLQQSNVKKVVIGACWSCYFNQVDRPSSKSNYYFSDGYQKIGINTAAGRNLALTELENFLRNLKVNKDVYLLLASPLSQNANPRLFLNKKRMGQALPMTINNYVINLTESELILRSQLLMIAKRAGVKVIDPVMYLCKDNACNGLVDDGQFIYKDESHLRPFFVKKYATYIDAAILKM